MSETVVLTKNDVGTVDAEGKIKRPRTSLRSFVETWQTSNSIDEVVAKLGINESSVRARKTTIAKMVKDAGKVLNWKKFPRKESTRTTKSVNYDELVELANSLVEREVEV